jgi:hypothetical protein
MSQGIIRFAEYRAFDEQRIEASNAMMGLLAGAQLASHLLQLTDGSDTLLPEVFPRVAHIRRFNLRTQAAKEILQAADTYLGAMSVPYALALHEDFLKTCAGLLTRDGKMTMPSRPALAQLHDLIETATGATFKPSSIIQIDTLRLMRNCTIHSGGRASQALIDHIGCWTPMVEANWARLTKQTLTDISLGDRIEFGHAELILTLAVTKALARQANIILRDSLSRELWAQLVVEDVQAEEHSSLNKRQLERKVHGMSRRHYAALRLSADELGAAMA